jgi:hypothetical protein
VPGVLDELAYGRFGPPFGRQLALFVVATKAEGATGDRIPQQSLFARTPPRVAGAGEAAPADTAPLALKRWKKRVESWLPRRLPPVVRRF